MTGALAASARGSWKRKLNSKGLERSGVGISHCEYNRGCCANVLLTTHVAKCTRSRAETYRTSSCERSAECEGKPAADVVGLSGGMWRFERHNPIMSTKSP